MARGSPTVSDDFGGTAGGLGGNYTSMQNTFGVMQLTGSGNFYGSSAQPLANRQMSRWSGAGSITKDGWASIIVSGFSGTLSTDYSVGCGYRATGADSTRSGYFIEVNADAAAGAAKTVRIIEWVNGTPTTRATGSVTVVNGDELGIDVEGNAPNIIVRGTLNGVAIGGGFTVTGLSANDVTGAPAVCGSGGSNVLGDTLRSGPFAVGGAASKIRKNNGLVFSPLVFC
jgi:hypothetical protein